MSKQGSLSRRYFHLLRSLEQVDKIMDLLQDQVRGGACWLSLWRQHLSLLPSFLLLWLPMVVQKMPEWRRKLQFLNAATWVRGKRRLVRAQLVGTLEGLCWACMWWGGYGKHATGVLLVLQQ